MYYYESSVKPNSCNEIQVGTKYHIFINIYHFYSTHLVTSVVLFYSEPLFTRQNPFHPASRGGNDHYHPSRKHSLSQKEKKTVWRNVNFTDTARHSCVSFFFIGITTMFGPFVLLQTLSPVRSNQQSSPHLTTLSPESHQLLEKRNRCFGVTDEQPVFAESWPSTESGSSPNSSTTSCDMEKPTHAVRARKSTISSELGVQQDSVLAKYALVIQPYPQIWQSICPKIFS